MKKSQIDTLTESTVTALETDRSGFKQNRTQSIRSPASQSITSGGKRLLQKQQSLVVTVQEPMQPTEEERQAIALQEQLAENTQRQFHIETQRLTSAPLLFGTEEIQQYRGHNSQNPMIGFLQNTNNNLNVSWDFRQIHFFGIGQDPQKKKSIPLLKILSDAELISTVAFSKRFRLYLIVTTDFKFIFLNENYNKVDHMDMSKLRLVTHAAFDDQRSQLVTAGIRGVLIFNFNYEGRYHPKLAANVNKKGDNIVINILNERPVQDNITWTKGLVPDYKNDVVIWWTDEVLSINTLSSGQTICQHSGLYEREEKVLDALLFVNYQYFMTATSQGNISVWKYGKTGKLVAGRQNQIHVFKGHFKAVTSIQECKSQQHVLISSSLDSTVRVWSLKTYHLLYTFHLHSGLTNSKLLCGASSVMTYRDEIIYFEKIHLICESFVQSDLKAVLLKPIFNALDDLEPKSILSLFDNNSALVKSLVDDQQSTLYPPPSTEVVEQIIHSRTQDRFITLLSNNAICVYRQFKTTCLLETIIDPSEVKDSERKRALTTKVSCFELFRTTHKKEIRVMDADVSNSKMHVLSLIAALADTCPYQEFVACGMSKGAVILLHVKQLTQLFSKYTVHRGAIKIIKYFTVNKVFLTICDQNFLKIWRPNHKEKRPDMIYQTKLTRKISRIDYLTSLDSDKFLVVMEDGNSEVCQLKNDEFFYLQSDKQIENESKLSGIDFNMKRGLIVTSTSDSHHGVIRIWNQSKKILREIQFPSRVDSVCFMNSHGDILVSHDLRISKIKMETYWTKIFDYYGITPDSGEELDRVRKDHESIYSKQDFQCEFEGDDWKKVTLELELFKKSDHEQSSKQLKKSEEADQESLINMRQMMANQVVKNKLQALKQPHSNTGPLQRQHFNDKKKFIIEPTEEDEPEQKKTNETTALMLELLKQNTDRCAIPKKSGHVVRKNMQLLPGMSYLSTSGNYFEMKRRLPQSTKATSRQSITSDRITSNILSFNQPTALIENHTMEVSSEFATTFNQSIFKMSIENSVLKSQIPLEYLLTQDLSQLLSNNSRQNSNIMGAKRQSTANSQLPSKIQQNQRQYITQPLTRNFKTSHTAKRNHRDLGPFNLQPNEDVWRRSQMKRENFRHQDTELDLISETKNSTEFAAEQVLSNTSGLIKVTSKPNSLQNTFYDSEGQKQRVSTFLVNRNLQADRTQQLFKGQLADPTVLDVLKERIKLKSGHQQRHSQLPQIYDMKLPISR